jgi:hypothetical protein
MALVAGDGTSRLIEQLEVLASRNDLEADWTNEKYG